MAEMHIPVGRNETVHPGNSPEVSGLNAREPSHHRDLGSINKFSEQVIDLAERLADMSEAAKGTRKPAARPAPVARPTPPKPVPVADRLSNDR